MCRNELENSSFSLVLRGREISENFPHVVCLVLRITRLTTNPIILSLIFILSNCVIFPNEELQWERGHSLWKKDPAALLQIRTRLWALLSVSERKRANYGKGRGLKAREERSFFLSLWDKSLLHPASWHLYFPASGILILFRSFLLNFKWILEKYTALFIAWFWFLALI